MDLFVYMYASKQYMYMVAVAGDWFVAYSCWTVVHNAILCRTVHVDVQQDILCEVCALEMCMMAGRGAAATCRWWMLGTKNMAHTCTSRIFLCTMYILCAYLVIASPAVHRAGER